MPEIIHEFEIGVAPERLREELFRADRLGNYFHTVQETEGNADRASWKLKAPFRATLGAGSLECQVLERSGLRCAWKASAPYLTWEGKLELNPTGQNTLVHFHLQIVDTGPLAAVHNAMIAVQIKNVAKLFERSLREKMEGKA